MPPGGTPTRRPAPSARTNSAIASRGGFLDRHDIEKASAASLRAMCRQYAIPTTGDLNLLRTRVLSHFDARGTVNEQTQQLDPDGNPFHTPRSAKPAPPVQVEHRTEPRGVKITTSTKRLVGEPPQPPSTSNCQMAKGSILAKSSSLGPVQNITAKSNVVCGGKAAEKASHTFKEPIAKPLKPDELCRDGPAESVDARSCVGGQSADLAVLFKQAVTGDRRLNENEFQACLKALQTTKEASAIQSQKPVPIKVSINAAKVSLSKLPPIPTLHVADGVKATSSASKQPFGFNMSLNTPSAMRPPHIPYPIPPDTPGVTSSSALPIRGEPKENGTAKAEESRFDEGKDSHMKMDGEHPKVHPKDSDTPKRLVCDDKRSIRIGGDDIQHDDGVTKKFSTQPSGEGDLTSERRYPLDPSGRTLVPQENQRPISGPSLLHVGAVQAHATNKVVPKHNIETAADAEMLDIQRENPLPSVFSGAAGGPSPRNTESQLQLGNVKEFSTPAPAQTHQFSNNSMDENGISSSGIPIPGKDGFATPREIFRTFNRYEGPRVPRNDAVPAIQKPANQHRETPDRSNRLSMGSFRSSQRLSGIFTPITKQRAAAQVRESHEKLRRLDSVHNFSGRDSFRKKRPVSTTSSGVLMDLRKSTFGAGSSYVSERLQKRGSLQVQKKKQLPLAPSALRILREFETMRNQKRLNSGKKRSTSPLPVPPSALKRRRKEGDFTPSVRATIAKHNTEKGMEARTSMPFRNSVFEGDAPGKSGSSGISRKVSHGEEDSEKVGTAASGSSKKRLRKPEVNNSPKFSKVGSELSSGDKRQGSSAKNRGATAVDPEGEKFVPPTNVPDISLRNDDRLPNVDNSDELPRSTVNPFRSILKPSTTTPAVLANPSFGSEGSQALEGAFNSHSSGDAKPFPSFTASAEGLKTSAERVDTSIGLSFPCSVSPGETPRPQNTSVVSKAVSTVSQIDSLEPHTSGAQPSAGTGKLPIAIAFGKQNKSDAVSAGFGTQSKDYLHAPVPSRKQSLADNMPNAGNEDAENAPTIFGLPNTRNSPLHLGNEGPSQKSLELPVISPKSPNGLKEQPNRLGEHEGAPIAKPTSIPPYAQERRQAAALFAKVETPGALDVEDMANGKPRSDVLREEDKNISLKTVPAPGIVRSNLLKDVASDPPKALNGLSFNSGAIGSASVRERTASSGLVVENTKPDSTPLPSNPFKVPELQKPNTEVAKGTSNPSVEDEQSEQKESKGTSEQKISQIIPTPFNETGSPTGGVDDKNKSEADKSKTLASGDSSANPLGLFSGTPFPAPPMSTSIFSLSEGGKPTSGGVSTSALFGGAQTPNVFGQQQTPSKPPAKDPDAMATGLTPPASAARSFPAVNSQGPFSTNPNPETVPIFGQSQSNAKQTVTGDLFTGGSKGSTGLPFSFSKKTPSFATGSGGPFGESKFGTAMSSSGIGSAFVFGASSEERPKGDAPAAPSGPDRKENEAKPDPFASTFSAGPQFSPSQPPTMPSTGTDGNAPIFGFPDPSKESTATQSGTMFGASFASNNPFQASMASANAPTFRSNAASMPNFRSSGPAFGNNAPSAPTQFGSSAGGLPPVFGGSSSGSVFGSQTPSGFPSFGSSPAPSFGASQSTPFGSNSANLGESRFGNAAGMPGQQSSGAMFGQQPTPANGAFSMGAAVAPQSQRQVPRSKRRVLRARRTFHR